MYRLKCNHNYVLSFPTVSIINNWISSQIIFYERFSITFYHFKSSDECKWRECGTLNNLKNLMRHKEADQKKGGTEWILPDIMLESINKHIFPMRIEKKMVIL